MPSGSEPYTPHSHLSALTPLTDRADPALRFHREGGWWFYRWASSQVVAGITDRRIEPSQLFHGLPSSVTAVGAEQVHGGSVAMIGRSGSSTQTVPGCDALLTSLPGVTLLVRTADCLPIFFADLSRGIVGIAHAGWRGLAVSLPARVVAAFRHGYHSQAEALHVAIGPAIRACCYEVGPEFAARFGPFVQDRGTRRTCDLVGVAMDQLRRCGVRPDHVVDTQHCTACEAQHWFSLRREGPSTGRLTSAIMLRP
jgi:YfiH family protein